MVRQRADMRPGTNLKPERANLKCWDRVSWLGLFLHKMFKTWVF